MKTPPRNNQLVPGRDYETRESAQPNAAPKRPGPDAPARGDGEPDAHQRPANHRSAPSSKDGGGDA